MKMVEGCEIRPFSFGLLQLIDQQKQQFIAVNWPSETILKNIYIEIYIQILPSFYVCFFLPVSTLI